MDIKDTNNTHTGDKIAPVANNTHKPTNTVKTGNMDKTTGAPTSFNRGPRNKSSFANRGPNANRGPKKPHEYRKYDKPNATSNVRPEFEILAKRKVSRTMAGGRRMRFTVLLVTKIAKGTIGIGYGKALEAVDALNVALTQSRLKTNIFQVPMYQNRTFSHASIGKFGATQIQLLPGGKETGLKALGIPRKIAKMVGIEDGCIKVLTKAKSKHNLCKAFRKACESLIPNELIRKKFSENNAHKEKA